MTQPATAPSTDTQASTAAVDAGAFLELLRQRERGKLKIYMGSAAGVGKTYRMLQEAHELRRRNVDVVVGFVETHGRAETAALINDLEVLPRSRIEYRGVVLEEMDVAGILARRPQVALVDELAHTNVPGSPHRKRWEDVVQLLDAGINVISAVNVQHLESLNDVIASSLGVTVRETVPDWIVGMSDQVVNLDLSAEDLRLRLREGKIYPAEKIDAALANFFTPENLTTLRELALREVASSVDRVRTELERAETGETAAPSSADRIMVAMSSDPVSTKTLLRRASRIAGRLNTDWYCVYVQVPEERADRIDAERQRYLVANIQRAEELGAQTATLPGTDIAATLLKFARENGVRLVIVGASRRSRWKRLTKGSVIERLLRHAGELDVLVVGSDEASGDR